jgi:hypothetical protein
VQDISEITFRMENVFEFPLKTCLKNVLIVRNVQWDDTAYVKWSGGNVQWDDTAYVKWSGGKHWPFLSDFSEIFNLQVRFSKNPQTFRVSLSLLDHASS